MVHIKTEQEINDMVEGGRRLRIVVQELMKMVGPGKTTHQIDEFAKKLILKQKAEPSFTRVEGYSWVTCLPVNDEVVHTPPSSRTLKIGDVLTVDIGLYYKGLHVDYADTVVIGDIKDVRISKFLDTGKKALQLAIAKALPGNRIGHISEVIQNEVEGNGYFIIKELTGHGVGRELHEDPFVPGFLEGPIRGTYELKPGLVIAIEVIYSMGTRKIKYDTNNNWSILTADGSLSACFEHTIAITKTGNIIIT